MAVVSMAAGLSGCASNSAPEGWLLPPVEVQSGAHGGWIELRHAGAEERNTDGELIAVSADSVWVLVRERGVVVPTAAIAEGKLTLFAAQKGGLSGWVVGGTLATLSNGVFLIFTAPMWVIGGSLAVGAESRAPERNHPPLNWAELAPFARFPQGLPPRLDLETLR
jgi:hypothetical protein